MSMIKAVVIDPDAPNRLALADVEEPSPTPSEVLVRVSAISLNRGEVRRAEASEAGFRPGWDLAGTVERAAADGSGPREDSRVVGFLSLFHKVLAKPASDGLDRLARMEG